MTTLLKSKEMKTHSSQEIQCSRRRRRRLYYTYTCPL